MKKNPLQKHKIKHFFKYRNQRISFLGGSILLDWATLLVLGVLLLLTLLYVSFNLNKSIDDRIEENQVNGASIKTVSEEKLGKVLEEIDGKSGGEGERAVPAEEEI